MKDKRKVQSSVRINYRSSNRLLLRLMMDEVLQTDNERGRCRNLDPRRALPPAPLKSVADPSDVSGGKLTFRPAL